MWLDHDIPACLAPYAAVLERFGPGRRQGGRWYACCPAHEDRTPSLAFWLGDDGRLMLGCWANCAKADVMKAAGLKWADLFPPKDDGKRVVRAKVVARYPYHDERGVLLYQTERLEWVGADGVRRKRFRQRRPDGKGGWVYDLADVRRVLYRLPELMAADPARSVLVVVEGEKDCEAARQLGLVATTNVCGARSPWLDEYSEQLSGRHVVIIPDADAPGRRHAAEAAGSLMMHDAASVRIAGLPAKDLSDYVALLRRERLADAEVRGRLLGVLGEASQWRPARKLTAG